MDRLVVSEPFVSRSIDRHQGFPQAYDLRGDGMTEFEPGFSHLFSVDVPRDGDVQLGLSAGRRALHDDKPPLGTSELDGSIHCETQDVINLKGRVQPTIDLQHLLQAGRKRFGGRRVGD
jgi:hypothetical protein